MGRYLEPRKWGGHLGGFVTYLLVCSVDTVFLKVVIHPDDHGVFALSCCVSQNWFNSVIELKGWGR